MAYVDEHSYEEMIWELQRFQSEMEDRCDMLEDAGRDCVSIADARRERENHYRASC